MEESLLGLLALVVAGSALTIGVMRVQIRQRDRLLQQWLICHLGIARGCDHPGPCQCTYPDPEALVEETRDVVSKI